ncbi:MAG: glycosyltransferase family 39 protein, partial [Acidobacteriota bacterium]
MLCLLAMRDRWLVLVVLGAWLAVAIALLAFDLPLKHDEARFAVAARGDASWLYTAPGTVALARASLALGLGPRLVCMVAGAGVIVATWWLGRVVFSPRVGTCAAAVIAGAHPFALASASLLGDLPSAACAVAGIAVVARELERDDGPSWWLVACAPAFAAAFYLRYGHAPLLAIVAAAAACVYRRKLVARPRVVAATIGALAVLLVPHAVISMRVTGSPLGILELTAAVPGRSYVGAGLVAYLTSNPMSSFGVLGTPLVVAGLVAAVRPPERWRGPVFLVAIAIGQVVVLGLHTFAQPRYIFVATILLVTCGLDAVRRAVPMRV